MKANRRVYFALIHVSLWMAVLSLSACGGPAATATPAPPAELGLEALKNAQYAGIYAESVQLSDGVYEGEPFVEGGASRPTVVFQEPYAFGDLNGDGLQDAAVLLAENSGGTGIFVYLAAVVNVGGQALNAATELLGDRAQIQSLTIEAGVVTIKMVTHGPDDAMCCPTLTVVEAYELQQGALTRLWREVQAPPLQATDLLNASYTSEWPKDGLAPLVDGIYEEEIVPGSASKIIVQVVPDLYAFGDLNGDGLGDAVAILASTGGGSGTFITLEALINELGQARHVATASLGDRTQVQRVDVLEGQVIVEMVTHGPDDPMCCPSLQVVDTYELQGEALVQISRVEQLPPTPPSGGMPPTFAGLLAQIWVWQSYEGADETIAVPYPANYRLEFLLDSQLAVKADCNVASGTYFAEVNQVTLTIGPTTLAECLPGSLYDRYLSLLAEVRSYVRDGDSLYLELAGGSGRLVFSKYYAVTGRVAGPEGATLPEGAVLEAKVLDAAGQQVGGVWRQASQFPVDFEASYYALGIDPEGTYLLEVILTDAAGNVLFAAAEPVPVLTQGHSTYHLEVQVESAGM